MSLISDISTITTIPVSSIEKLIDKAELCMLHKLVENDKKGDIITNIDMGFGVLYIKHDNDEIKYKFIPSHNFESKVKKAITTGESPLVDAAEDALKDKLLNAYKDLF